MGLIRPLPEYGDVIWDSPNDLLNRLETIQLNAARIVIGATARSSSYELYRETGWETLASRRKHPRLTLMYKIVNGKAPAHFSDLVPSLVQNRTGYMLRNRGNLDVPLSRLLILSNSFFPLTSKAWNELDNSVKKSSIRGSL